MIDFHKFLTYNFGTDKVFLVPKARGLMWKKEFLRKPSG